MILHTFWKEAKAKKSEVGDELNPNMLPGFFLHTELCQPT